MKHLLLLPILFLGLLMTACNLPGSEVSSKKWVHTAGYSLGDSLIFEEDTLRVSHDSVIRNGTLSAYILEARMRADQGDEVLWIMSPNGEKIGRYLAK